MPGDGFGIFVLTNQVLDYKRLLTTYVENIFEKNDYSRNWEQEQTLAGNSNFKKFKQLRIDQGIEKKLSFHTSLSQSNSESSDTDATPSLVLNV